MGCAEVVEVCETCGDVFTDFCGLRGAQFDAGECEHVHWAAFDAFGGEEVPTALFTGFVDGENGGMMALRTITCFIEERVPACGRGSD